MKSGMEATDPYELYLLAVFESCDDFYQGGLSAAGLEELCEKLQLGDRCDKLRECLFGDSKTKRVPFLEFKEGLLKLLDDMESEQITDGEICPGQGDSSRTLFGRKKHGRKVRAQDNIDNDGNLSDGVFTKDRSQQHCCSTDESSPEEAVPKKRKIKGSKRMERQSGKNELIIDGTNASTTNTTNEVEHLVTAWSNISSGGTDCLSREELVKVFQCVGLERGSEEAAQCVFEKLGIDDHGRITLRELLEFIRSGESWSKEGRGQLMELESTQKNISINFSEPSLMGCITGAGLVEHWEYAGVPGAAQLLQNLGFSQTQQIDLSSLVSMLSDEIKSLNDETKSTRRSMDPHLALLRANSVLQCLYIQSLKTMMEHVSAEKEKFKNDVMEANQRALLLAQEVDDHHSKLEHSSQQHVKYLEHKHSEKVRELTNQAKLEQDALVAQNMTLERKLKELESGEAKNKSVISQLELENKLLEQENRAVADQLMAVQTTKKKLEKDLENVVMLQQRVAELEAAMNENDVVSLLERLQTLEKENTQLRDRNDELSVEVEELSTKLSNAFIKKRSSTSGSATPSEQPKEEAFGGGGMKRRGDSSLELVESGEDSGGEEGSPRLGKVRKCSHMKDFAATTSSLKELNIGSARANSCHSDKEDSANLKPGFASSDDNSIEEYSEVGSFKMTPFSEEFLQQATGISSDSTVTDVADSNMLKSIEQKLKAFDKDLCRQVVSLISDLSNKKSCLGENVESLKGRCRELETSLELLKEEYEKTEDYWSEKLEEERMYFEDEQRSSDKKYSELLDKILEYEEMLNAEKGQKQRLETIEERDCFEKQVAEMEQECRDLRNEMAETIKSKDSEIEKLRKEVERSKVSEDRVDSGVQVSQDSDSDQITNQGVQSSNVKVRSPNKHHACKNCAELKNLQEAKFKYQREIESMRGEWERLFKELNENKRILTSFGELGGGDFGKSRNIHLEQRCHNLMLTLRQQQKQTEDILKNTWRQHKVEVNDLKSVIKMTEEKLKRQTKVIQEQLNKLTKTDLLVKDLFVENAYLLSSVQKLEQRCRPSSNAVGE